MYPDRRQFIGALTGLAGLGALGDALGAPPAPGGADAFSCNAYNWHTFFAREGRDWYADLDAGLAEFARSGLRHYEPSIDAPEQLTALVPLLARHGLGMPSVYVGSTLHDAAQVDRSIDAVLAIGEAAKAAGVRIVVTNPSPIRWGGPEDKDDAQLAVQAAGLDRLGAALRRMGLVLAYHNHDPEMRRAAREFHHMMLGTDPEHVRLCLDAHWVFRGAGDSQVALFDIVRLYGSRIAEVHLRQSQAGVWTEVFGDGDIDYARLAAELLRLGNRPHLVLEQCVEAQTPHTMGPVEAHRRGLAYAAERFAALVG